MRNFVVVALLLAGSAALADSTGLPAAGTGMLFSSSKAGASTACNSATASCLYQATDGTLHYSNTASGVTDFQVGQGGSNVSLTCGAGMSCSPSTITGTGSVSVASTVPVCTPTTSGDYCSWSGTAWQRTAAPTGGGTQGGSTTASHLPYASGANTLSDSPISYTSGTTTLSCAAGTNFDYSASSGTFKTPTGATTVGGDLNVNGSNGVIFPGNGTVKAAGGSLTAFANGTASFFIMNSVDFFLSLGAGTAQWLFTSSAIQPNGSAVLDVGTTTAPFRGSYLKRYTTKGTPLVAGNFALSSGWGTTASVTVNSGCDSAFSITVTSGGTGQAANPTITLTYQDGTWGNAPNAMAKIEAATSSSDLSTPVTETTTATTLVVTYHGTPVAGNTYSFSARVLGL